MQKYIVNWQRVFFVTAVVGIALVEMPVAVRAQQASGFGTLNGLVPAKNIKMPMPSDPSVALHGSVTSNAGTIRDKAPVLFTYKVTNTSKTVRYASVPAGGAITIVVKAHGSNKPDTAIWTSSRSLQNQGQQGQLTFAPGETKTFTAEWTPSTGTTKTYKNFVVEACLIGTVTKQHAANVPTAKHGPPALAKLILKGA